MAQQAQLSLHCGAEEVTRDDVLAVPVPNATETYTPGPYREILDHVFDRINMLGLPVASEQYGLNHGGAQMFAAISVGTADLEGPTDYGLCIGIRQSYDKSLARGIAIGARIFVCDNLSFTSDAFTILRRNTRHADRDFGRAVDNALFGAAGQFAVQRRQFEAMKRTPVELDHGYELLGLALGHQIIKAQQASVAIGDWRKPRYEDFSERSLWSLYNCVTEGLKRGKAGDVIDRHVAANDFFIAQIAN